MLTISMPSHISKGALLSLLLPLAGLYSSVAESCPLGIAYQNCSGCHSGGTFAYTASWTSIPPVLERNTTDTVTFNMATAGTVADGGGFSARTTGVGSFTATSGETNISATNVSHSIPSAAFSWSFTFNSGATSGTATLEAYGNPITQNRTLPSTNDNSLCNPHTTPPAYAGGTAGTAGDGNTGSVFPTANTSIPVNDRPVITAGGSNASFTENGSAATVAPSLSLTDLENSATEIQSGSVTITTNYNAGDGDRLNISGATCTTNNLSCSGSGTRTITISGGSESALEFQNVLRAITFDNTSDTPSTATRTVQFSVTDQFSRPRSDTRNVTVDTFEDPADFDTPVYNRIGSGTSSNPIQSAIEDILIQLQFAATDPEGVSTTYSLVSTTPTLTGPEPLIAVSGSGLLSWTPDGTRTSVIAIVGVNDDVGGVPDNTFQITLNVVGVNDPPIIAEGLSTSVDIDEDETPTAFALILNAADFDGDTIQWNINTQGTKGLASTTGSGNSKVIGYMPFANEFGADSFIVRATDTIAQDLITVNVVIAAVNDAPVITAVGAQAGIEGSLLTITPGVTDVDDMNNGTDISWSIVSGVQAGMLISNMGVITWIPPLGPPAIFGQSYPITIRAADDGFDGAAPDDDSFTLTINPPDTDNDLIANYDDLCLTISDGSNADNDGDGTAGTDGGANDGGDVCDLDDDNDGMPDTFESTNGLNPFDSADAILDADGDGISNLDEFLAGSNPNFASITVESTGYLTPYTLVSPVPTVIAAGAIAVVADNTGPYRPGHFDITWTASNSTVTLGTSIQSLDVRPIVSFAPDQQAAEASTVNVVATLNGSAATYPVTVNYTVSGTADASDHNAVAGSFVITTPNQMVSFPFNVLADTLNEGTETVVFTMASATNAVLGSDVTHVVSIVEGNVAPVVNLQISQGGNDVSTAYVSGGTVTINAIIADVNIAQTHTYDWSMTSNSLSPPTNITSSSWTFTPVAGSDPFENFLIDVNSTDSGSPSLSNRVSQILSVVAVAPILTATDTDGDGTNDDDPAEGLDDSDQDGIPDYLDAQSAGVTDQHLIPNQTAATDNATWFLVQAEPGIKIVTGNTARASNNSGVIVTDANIGSFGSVLGGVPLNANDDFDHVGGIVDFELSGLVPGQSANIVIPLQSAIPINAIFRKFNPDTGWSNFVVDNNNRLASAPGVLGACPETGSSQYTDGLVAFSNCLQLTIQDGGPNDADGVANGVIKDPGSLSITLQAPVTPTVRGSGRIDLVMLLGLFLLIWVRVYAHHRASRR